MQRKQQEAVLRLLDGLHREHERASRHVVSQRPVPYARVCEVYRSETTLPPDTHQCRVPDTEYRPSLYRARGIDVVLVQPLLTV